MITASTLLTTGIGNGSASSSDLTPLSSFLLYYTDILDSHGAHDWDLRIVAVLSAVFFLSMRKTIGHTWNVDWDAFVHGMLVGIGSLICVYLNFYASLPLTGLSEPIRSIQKCQRPLTSLHRIIPAITQGYSICDIINGFTLGPEFLAHGVATFVSMSIFNELGASHVMTPVLTMEISTIILAILRAEFFTPLIQLMTQASFALSFFLCRIILSPYLMYQTLIYMYPTTATTTEDGGGDCFPRLLFYATFILGSFFTCLNTFWFYKLVKKIQRKLSGEEHMTEMKELKDE